MVMAHVNGHRDGIIQRQYVPTICACTTEDQLSGKMYGSASLTCSLALLIRAQENPTEHYTIVWQLNCAYEGAIASFNLVEVAAVWLSSAHALVMRMRSGVVEWDTSPQQYGEAAERSGWQLLERPT